MFRFLTRRSRTVRQPVRHSRPSLETLETRLTPATLTTLAFNVPADVAALGVQLGLYGSVSSAANASEVYLAGSAGTYSFQPVPTPPAGTTGTLPLISLVAPGSYTQPQSISLPIPSGQAVYSGELFIFVGTVATGLVVVQDATTGVVTVAAPKGVPDPATGLTPDNFAQFEFTYDGSNLDIDISAVDSTGYPFTLVYPSADVGFPRTSLGITLPQKDLVANFQSAFNTGGVYANYPQFQQSGLFNPQQVVAPQDILAEETGAPPILTKAAPLSDPDSHLQPGANYWYVVTAYSNHVIPNSGGVLGETLASNAFSVANLAAGNSIQLTWNAYADPNTAGYNVYRYSATSSDGPTSATAYHLVAHLPGPGVTTWTDQGAVPQAQQIVPATASNYGFNPLSTYYTQALLDFFNHYRTSTFSLHRDSVLWLGNTVTYTPSASWNTVTLAGSFVQGSTTVHLDFPQVAGTTTANSQTLLLTNGTTAGLAAGMGVTGPGILAGTTVAAITGPTSLALSNGATQTGAGVFTFTQSLAVGQTLSGPGIAPGTAITTVARDSVTLSQPTTAASTPGEMLTAQAAYTVLQLTAQNSSGSIQQGDVANVYQPVFSSNTRFVTANPPPMPSWLAAAFNPRESPGQMVFACDAVFASNGLDPDSNDAVGDIENSIVSAFNRGLATNYAVPPDNWAGFPAMSTPALVAADPQSQVAVTTTWYYAVTALNALGESTPGMTLAATLVPGQGATLNWTNGSAFNGPATGYNVYRGSSPANLTLLATTTSTTFTDHGGPSSSSVTPPYRFFAPGSTANWYADYVQSNSTVDPARGVSINGLSYGFPYSDQGGVSTNVYFSATEIPATITINLGELQSPGFVTQMLPDAVVGSAYRQAIVPAGNAAGAVFSAQGLPAWLTLNPSTGVLTGTPASTAGSPYSFTVSVTTSGGATAQPFTLAVDAAAPAALLTIVGATGGTLTLPAAEINKSYTATLTVTGGTGPYTLSAQSAAPPPGTSWTSTTSSTGVFTLTGVPTSANASYGFTVTIDDSAGNSASTVAQVTVNPALAITTTSLPTAGVNQPYSRTIGTNVTGLSVTFSLGQGSLPPGLTLSPTGVLSGTPTATGATTFTVNATDSFNAQASQPYTLTVASLAPLQVTTSSLPLAATTAAYSQTLAVTGGSTPYSFTVVNGDLPAGLALNPTSGAVTGTPTATGIATFTVRVTDALGHTAFQGYALTVLGVTPAATPIAANAASLAISGAGFDPVAANNTVTFSVPHGTLAGTVTQATPTLLVVALTPAGLVAGDTVSAVVTVNGLASSAAPGTAVATVVPTAAPAVTPSTTHLAINAPSLTLTGSGFDPVAANNIVTFTVPHGTLTGAVTQATATSLTVALSGKGLQIGDTVQAAVTTDGVTSATVPVAALTAASTPSINANTGQLANNATSLVLTGTGFDPTAAGSTIVTLALPTGTPVPVTGVAVTSPTQLTVSVASLSGLSGVLNAALTVNGVPAPLPPAQNGVQVASLIAPAAPQIFVSGTPALAANATTLTFFGSGFNPGATVALTANYSAVGPIPVAGPSGPLFTTTVVTPNQITLTNLAVPQSVPLVQMTSVGSGYTSAPTVAFSGGGATVQAAGVAQLQGGQVVGVTITATGSGYTSAPTVTFTGGGASTPAAGTVSLTPLLTAANLQAQVTDPANGPGNKPTIATVQPAARPAPTLTGGQLSGLTLTLTGAGFDSGGTNLVTLYAGSASNPLPPGAIALLANGAGPNIVAASATQLVVTLAGPLPTGPVLASIITDGVPMAGNPVQVATGGTGAPTVTPSTTALSVSPTLLTITGSGFDPQNGAVNTVALFTGSTPVPLPAGTADSVVARSATQLTVALDTATPLPAGPLSAVVTTSGVSSGSPVQVATLVAGGPTVRFSAASLSSLAPTLTILGTGFDPVSANNTVTLATTAGPIPGAVAGVTASPDGVSLVVQLTSGALTSGPLYATVQTTLAASALVQVAAVIISQPAGGGQTPSEQFVSQLYLDLLGRPADPDGLAWFSGLLDQGTPRSQVVAILLASPEYLATLVQQAFQQVLARPAAPADVAYGLSLLGGGMTVEVYTAQLLSSPEFYARQGGVDPGWVSGLYRVVLGREPDAAGLQSWLQALAGGTSRLAVARAFVEGPESDALRVQAAYVKFLHRPADPAGLASSLAMLSHGSVTGLVAALTSSPEYFGDASLTVHQAYVQQLYRDLLVREPSPEELAAWTAMLDQGSATPAQVADAFLTSLEYRIRLVQRAYTHYLGRPADPEGLQASLALLANGTEEQMTAALIGSLEYYLRSGGTSAGFLTALYRDVLGRPIDPAGEATWTAALSGGATGEQVATSVLAGEEHRRDLVAGWYRHFLRRPADPASLAYWVGQLNAGAGNEQVIASLVSSPEYFGLF